MQQASLNGGTGRAVLALCVRAARNSWSRAASSRRSVVMGLVVVAVAFACQYERPGANLKV
jgi:hypothetical protein